MPSPVAPSQIKATLPAVGGAACDKFQKAFKTFPALFSAWYSYMYREDGSFADGFRADVCALDCGAAGAGGLVPNPFMPAPGTVTASTDQTDRINITWTAVTPTFGHPPVTRYNLFRSLSTDTDPSLATFFASVPGLTYSDLVSDGGITIGPHYNYWVEATNGTDTSAYSTPAADGVVTP